MNNDTTYDDIVIEELIESCDDLMKMIEELKAENNLLTEVILKHRLGYEVEEIRNGVRPKSSAEKQAAEFKRLLHIQ